MLHDLVDQVALRDPAYRYRLLCQALCVRENQLGISLHYVGSLEELKLNPPRLCKTRKPFVNFVAPKGFPE